MQIEPKSVILVEMTIETWLKITKTQIDALDAELIALAGLAEAVPLEADRSFLQAHPEMGLSQAQWEKLDAMLARRAAGEPLAYILGKKEFYGRDFQVDARALIPRPETENLVEMALETLGSPLGDVSDQAHSEQAFSQTALKKAPSGLKIVEIGTGSGCIALTLALERPGVEILALEKSAGALAVARQNYATYQPEIAKKGSKVEFLESDLLQNLEKTANFDLMIANLPYVDPEWGWLERKSLDFEPQMALYAGEKGLELYRRLLTECAERPLIAPWLIFEADPCQHSALVELAAQQGYKWQKTQGFGLIFAKNQQ